MARVTGLEPATSGVTGRHSNQLSYTRVLVRCVRLGAAPLRQAHRAVNCLERVSGFFARPALTGSRKAVAIKSALTIFWRIGRQSPLHRQQASGAVHIL